MWNWEQYGISWSLEVILLDIKYRKGSFIGVMASIPPQFCNPGELAITSSRSFPRVLSS